jgi:Fe-S-cluster containining protein
MSIARKVSAVERLFGKLDKEISGFQAETGLHCLAGCGKCCTKPDIDASPLEFLPYAFHLFLNHRADEVLQKLLDKPDSICVIYQPLTVEDKVNGRCSEYPYRGLICRLFGYGASRDKFGELRLATCKLIKEHQASSYEHAVKNIKEGVYVPIFSDYYQQLNQIDFRLGNMILPINEAIKIAIETVLHHYAYRPFPRGLKRVA